MRSGFFHAFKERSCYVHRVAFSRLGLPFRTSILIVIFLLPLLNFSADIFIINTCGSHVNPRTAEWMLSMLFSLLRSGQWCQTPELYAHCIHSSCVHNVQSLLGVIFNLVGVISFLTDCSNFLLLFTQGYGEVSLSKRRVLFAQFLCTQYTELAGCESEIKFLFSSELFSSVYLSFLMFGVQGVETSCKLCIGAFNFPKL